jgi:glutamate 5-kinase
MISKLRAAKLASDGGVHVAIVNGRHPEAITAGMERKIGTYFPPRRTDKRRINKQRSVKKDV